MCFGTATNCTFFRNTARYNGGGIHTGTATNCTFTENAADAGGGTSYCTARNCTFVGNSAKQVGGGMYEGTATNCILWGNTPEESATTTVTFSCSTAEIAGTGNIVADPSFVNPWEGDFRLRAASPCVDSGTASGAPGTDLFGRVRPQGAGVDMGAYEYHPGDDDNVALPPAVLRVNAAATATKPDGLTWETAYPTLQTAADHAGFGTEIWVVQGTYTVTEGNQVLLLPWPGIAVYGGFTGTETARDARGLDAAATVIDGQGARRGVTAKADTRIDGFTVQNGMAEQGGGMYSGAAINCTFTGNTGTANSGFGGGMHKGTADRCTFSGNTAFWGGGLYASSATNCTVVNNAALSIVSYSVEENIYEMGGKGGGMCQGTATNCVFSGNTAAYGGALYDSAATNCTAVGNAAVSTEYCDLGIPCFTLGGVGGAINGEGMAANCIFWQNTPFDVSPDFAVSYSCLSVAVSGAGNIAADPLFVDAAAGDFRLQSGSPCIDTGTAEGAPATDIVGLLRPQGVGFDMGAHEAVVPVTMPDLTGLARSTAKELILAARLYVGRETEEYHLTVPADHITRHTPAAGVQTPQWTPVDLVVSLGGIAVPDVLGQTQDAALSIIAAAELAVGAVTQQYSLTVPAGGVISQSPVPGTQVLPGTAIDLVVSRGGIAVPDVVGQVQSQASAALVNAQLVVGAVAQQYSLTVPAGTVLSQSPPAGAQALPGTPVDLAVSRGVQPTVMPDVVGQPRAQAESAVSTAGLTLGLVTQAHSSTVAVDGVISQSPAAGTELPPGTAVSMVVSLGAEPVVEGEGEPVDIDTAKQQLAEAYDTADTNGDGALSFDESAAAVPGLTAATFDEIDTNGDGQLSQDELGVDDGAGCAGCQGRKGLLGPAGAGKHMGELFLTALGALGLVMMSTLRRP
jgi:beta-lactam-binding protein with PASTA domain